MAEMEDGVRWSQFPKDLLTMIAKRLNNRVDNLRLRSVCSLWRSSIPPFNETPPLPLQLPFPLSPHHSLNPKRRAHFSLIQNTIYFLQPPPNENTKPNASNSTPSTPWLLRVDEIKNGKMHPLNPLSKIMTVNVPKTFPKVLNLLNFRITEIGKAYNLEFVDLSEKKIETNWEESKLIRVKKVVLSSNPLTTDGGDYAVIAIQKGKLWFLKVGDGKWMAVNDPKQSHYDDCVYHKGKFYAVDHRGRTVLISSNLRAEEIVASMPGGGGGGQFKYLVESCGDLFLVDKNRDPEEQISYDEDVDDYILEVFDPDMPLHLKVYKLNEEGKRWEWVETLGDRVLFVGDDCSYSVSTQDFAGLKENIIYFCDDMFADNEEERNLAEICRDTSVFNLEEGSCGPLVSFPDHSRIFWPPPAWLKRTTRKK